jgi:hypothetical protein
MKTINELNIKELKQIIKFKERIRKLNKKLENILNSVSVKTIKSKRRKMSIKARRNISRGIRLSWKKRLNNK